MVLEDSTSCLSWFQQTWSNDKPSSLTISNKLLQKSSWLLQYSIQRKPETTREHQLLEGAAQSRRLTNGLSSSQNTIHFNNFQHGYLLLPSTRLPVRIFAAFWWLWIPNAIYSSSSRTFGQTPSVTNRKNAAILCDTSETLNLTWKVCWDYFLDLLRLLKIQFAGICGAVSESWNVTFEWSSFLPLDIVPQTSTAPSKSELVAFF